MSEKIKDKIGQLGSFKVPFFQVPNDIFEIGLDTYEMSVYFYLARLSNNGSTAFPSYKTIGEKSGMSRRKAINVVKALEEKGLLVKATRTSKESLNTSNIYEINPNVSKGGEQGALGVVHEVHQGSAQGAPYKELDYKELNYKENPSVDSKESTKKDSKTEYQFVYDYYLTKDNLISHQRYTEGMYRAFKKAKRELALTEKDFETIIDRHSRIVELTKHSKYAVRPQSVHALFGEKAFGKTVLKCSEYLDDGDKYINFLKGKGEQNNDLPKGFIGDF